MACPNSVGARVQAGANDRAVRAVAFEGTRASGHRLHGRTLIGVGARVHARARAAARSTVLRAARRTASAARARLAAAGGPGASGGAALSGGTARAAASAFPSGAASASRTPARLIRTAVLHARTAGAARRSAAAAGSSCAPTATAGRRAARSSRAGGTRRVVTAAVEERRGSSENQQSADRDRCTSHRNPPHRNDNQVGTAGSSRRMIGRCFEPGARNREPAKAASTRNGSEFVVSVCFRAYRTTSDAGDFARAIW